MFPAGFLLSQGHVWLSFGLRHMSYALFFFVSGGIYSYGGAERLVFCRGKVNTVSLESQQFFPGFLCAGRAWFFGFFLCEGGTVCEALCSTDSTLTLAKDESLLES